MSMSDVYTKSVELHKQHQGKLEVNGRMPVTSRQELSLAYSPGVAEPCRVIAKDPDTSYDLTWRGRTVAVVSDGSAVLGLGNIGAVAGLPVMEGKSLLLKEFGGVDSVPLVIDAHEPGDIVRFVKQLAPSFAGINLEDIAAPICFEVEEALQDIGIPVFHDDQHGTAIVVASALRNAAQVVGKNYADLKVVIIGAGAAGLATAKMLLGLNCEADRCELLPNAQRVADVIIVDSKGSIYPGRPDLNVYKQAVAGVSNRQKLKGDAAAAVAGADVVIGVSGPGNITPEMVRSMAPKAIVFGLANPTPEIMPELAKEAGAMVVATGRSDYPNQINNVLAFPGIFRAVIDGRLKQITMEHKLRAVEALVEITAQSGEITAERVVPDPFTPNLAEFMAKRILALTP